MKDRLATSFLSPVDEVDVVLLRHESTRTIGDEAFVQAFDAAPSFRVTEVDAREIERLWRALPHGDYMRCHNPPFGLRFYRERRVVCRATLCWECNNIIGRADDESFSCAFDAEHPVALALLELLKKCAVGREQS